MAYELVKNVRYEPEASRYRGKAELCTFSFKLGPEQLFFTRWLAERIVDAFKSVALGKGAKPLALKMWEDKAPTWWTNYKVTLIAHASPIWWAPIIAGILAVLGLVGIGYIVHEVKEIDWGKAAKPLGTAAGVLLLGLLILIGSKEK